jgi:signal transduction histidine kinase
VAAITRRRSGPPAGRAADRTARDARLVTLAAAAVCTLVTALGFLPPPAARSYANPSLRVVLETATTLVALLAAYLVFGRYRLSRRTSDFVLVCALELIALRSIFFAAHPAVAPEELGIFATWAQVAAAVAGAAAFAAGAFAPDSRIRHRRRVAVVLLGLPLVVGAIATVEAAVIPELPFGVERPADEPAYVALQLAAAALFVIAAIGFTRRAGRTGDDLMRWFAAGATVAAFARLNFAFFPPFFDERVYTGDVLRFGFTVVLLVGAMREIQAYWRNRAEAAALEERRRLARDLHDGVAQELAYVAAQARALAARDDRDGGLARLAAAGERALDESRRAIAALTRPVDEPLDVALAQAAEEVAQRAGARVRLDLAADVVLSAARREALIRIAREAVANAARHGRAQTIDVQLAAAPLRLRIVDDGRGFDPALAAGGPGFGLTSMRERAESLGGVFRAESTPGQGSVIEVTIP